jgi:hypothetical protein
MMIRPIRNEKSSNSPDYDQIQNLNLYRTLNPQYNNEGDINERISAGPDYDFNLFENNNNNYSDFIREFNSIHPPNNNRLISAPYDSSSGLLHPPDYNNSLLHPSNQGNIPLYDENGDLNPAIRNIHEYYQNNRDSNLFYNPLSSDNIIHRPNHPRQVGHSFSIFDPSLRHSFIQPSNLPDSNTQRFS